MSATPSLERVCLDVKLPRVVISHRSDLTRAIFRQLLIESDDQGFVELDASKLSQSLGISRRKIYYAIRFFQKVNLLFCKIRRTGRGNHSLFKLNWKKCAQTIDKLKDLIPLKDRFSIRKPNRFKSPWNQKMKAFRELLQYSWLDPDERSLCLNVLGRYLKKRSRRESLEIYHSLAAVLHELAPPMWANTKSKLCAWWTLQIKAVTPEGSTRT